MAPRAFSDTEAECADRDWFQRLVRLADAEADAPLTVALGLGDRRLAYLFGRWLPQASALLQGLTGQPGSDALEEADLRGYLWECRAGRELLVEESLAAIIARRCRYPNHLWQDLGCRDRSELNALISRHFPELLRRNRDDMKWKKFLYRELCRREGVPVCKSPSCDSCEDQVFCFGGEVGQSLIDAPHRDH